jgi:hypothetical protein
VSGKKDAAYRDGVVHVDVIKDRLSRSSRRILGDENVNDVSLEVVDQRADVKFRQKQQGNACDGGRKWLNTEKHKSGSLIRDRYIPGQPQSCYLRTQNNRPPGRRDLGVPERGRRTRRVQC